MPSEENMDMNIDIDDELTPEVMREHIKSVIHEVGSSWTKEQKKEHASLLLKIFEKKMNPQQAMNISKQEMAELYSYAYDLFSHGRYADACEIFKMLCTLDPSKLEFVTAIGVCIHRQKDYEGALPFYMISASFTNDPLPYLYSYDCYVNLKQLPIAGIMLSNAISNAGSEPKYAKLKERAQLLLDELKKKITSQQQ